MVNPCNECIVSMMCTTHCDNLFSYFLSLFDNKIQNVGTLHTVVYYMRLSKIDEILREAQIYYTTGSDVSKEMGSKHVAILVRGSDVCQVEYGNKYISFPRNPSLRYVFRSYENVKINTGYLLDNGREIFDVR